MNTRLTKFLNETEFSLSKLKREYISPLKKAVSRLAKSISSVDKDDLIEKIGLKKDQTITKDDPDIKALVNYIYDYISYEILSAHLRVFSTVKNATDFVHAHNTIQTRMTQISNEIRSTVYGLISKLTALHAARNFGFDKLQEEFIRKNFLAMMNSTGEKQSSILIRLRTFLGNDKQFNHIAIFNNEISSALREAGQLFNG